ncbi:MAG: alpha/beta hydrolase [Bacteroidota bacterium]|nr:alpha/beta hydrolase [Bacteroidota bacterium]
MKKIKFHLTFLLFYVAVFLFTSLIPLNTISSFNKTDKDKNCYDQSDHKVSFIEVEKGIKLEVLDWGGSGEYLVMLTGLGDNAHVFDHFAYQFTDLFHVIGITRRGFGMSDKPDTGYSEERRVHDILSILDNLGIQSAIFAGHSIAGGELSQLGIFHKDRVKKLIYMDAAPDFGQHKFLDQPPGVEYTQEDLVSVERFIAATVRMYGYREPNAAICNGYTIGNNGEIVDFKSPPEVSAQIIKSAEDKDFTKIDVPVLAFFDEFKDEYRLPFFYYLDSTKQTEFLQAWYPLVQWQQELIKRFSDDVKNIEVIKMQEAYHYIYLNRESDVARAMRKFLGAK